MEDRVEKKKRRIFECREEKERRERLKGFDKCRKMRKVERLRGD